MRRRQPVLLLSLVVATVLIVSLGGGGCSREQEVPERVLVFGIDGGTWDVIEPMFADGELPTLRRLYERGIHGILETRPPAISPVVWSTIFTGRPWQEHGVKNWKTSQSSHRKVKAIWNIATDLDLESIVMNVPSTWPPEEIRGAMVSGFPLSGSTVGGNTGEVVSGTEALSAETLPAHYRRNAKRIAERMDELAVGDWSDWFEVPVPGRPAWRAVMRVFRFEPTGYYLTPLYRVDSELAITHPPGLRAEIEAATGEPYIPEGPGWSKHAEEDTPKYLYDHLRQVAWIQARAAAFLAGRPWDLFVFVDTFVDRVSHPYWAYMSPQDYDGLDPAKAARYSEAVRNAYRETDRQLAMVLERTGENLWIVIASDHGFHSNRDRNAFIGTHAMDGIYLVSAPGLERVEGRRAYIEDITPTVLYLLGQPVAADMQGRVLPEVAAAVGRTIAQVPSYEGTRQKDGSEIPVDEQTWEQLRGLGYVDGAPPRRAPEER